MIKMIGLDLDGTVLNDRKKITPRTKKAISLALKKGVIVLPATGRPFYGIPDEFLELKGVRYALSANGAAIHDMAEKKKIHEDCMDYEKILELLRLLQPFDILADVFIDGMGYAQEENLARNLQYAPSIPVRDYIKKTRRPVPDLLAFVEKKKQDIEKMTVNFRQKEDGGLYGRDEVLEIVSSHQELSVVSGIPTNLEITKKTATKGRGLVLLARLLGLKREEIMACGDSGNDKEMLESAGFGVAMENSSDEVLGVCDYVTKSNEEDGVAYAIEQFVL